HRVAGRKSADGHLLDIRHVPCTDDDSPGIRSRPDHLDRLRDLVDLPTVQRPPTTPLGSVHGPKLAVAGSKVVVVPHHRHELRELLLPRIAINLRHGLPGLDEPRSERPLIPDRNAIVYEVLDVGASLEEPQQLVDNALHVQLFGRNRREPLLEIETHLMAEDAQRPCAGAIVLPGAIVQNVLQQVEILLHRVYLPLRANHMGAYTVRSPLILWYPISPRMERQRSAWNRLLRTSLPGRIADVTY